MFALLHELRSIIGCCFKVSTHCTNDSKQAKYARKYDILASCLRVYIELCCGCLKSLSALMVFC